MTKGTWLRKQSLETGIPVTTTESIQFKYKKYYMVKGITETNPLFNTIGKSIKYKSSSKAVSIESDGAMTAKKKGKATITATVGGKSYTCKVIVLSRNVKNRLNTFVKNYIKSGMSDYEKILVAHNWLISHCVYDNEALETGKLTDKDHSAAGALLEGTGVCDSYAKAFQQLMWKMKFRCKIISYYSTYIDHSWNMVKLNGKWYHVDTTYDDPLLVGTSVGDMPVDFGIDYSFFLKSDKYMIHNHDCVSKKMKLSVKANSTKYDKMNCSNSTYSWTL